MNANTNIDTTETVELNAAIAQNLINHIEHSFRDRDMELDNTDLGTHVEHAKKALDETNTEEDLVSDTAGYGIFNFDKMHLCADLGGELEFRTIEKAADAIESFPQDDTDHLEIVELRAINPLNDPRND